MTKRIGVIGAGISGLSVAHLLSQKGYVVDIFEKESRLGGHTDTHTIELHGSNVNVDSGFIVFNNKNYKHLINLFRELNIKSINQICPFHILLSHIHGLQKTSLILINIYQLGSSDC